jgi:hypothetical protein
MDKKQLAEAYLDANEYKIRCAAIDRDAEDLVINAFIAGYEAGHSAGFEGCLKAQELLSEHLEEKLVEELFVNVEPLLKGK